MSAVDIVVKSNFARNKGQNILVGMVVAVCALIMSTGFATFGGMFSAFDSMNRNQNAADLMVILDESLYDTTAEYEWWKENEDIKQISELIPCTGTKYINYDGKKLSLYSESVYFAVKYPNEEIDILNLTTGEKKETPNYGEVWIPSCYADANNISIGDSITVPVEDDEVALKVSGFVTDPYYSSGFIYPYRFWISDDTYDEVATDGKSFLIALKVNDDVSIDAVWKDFTDHLDNAFVGTMLDISSVRFAYLIMTGIICGVLLVFSILILVITLYVVSNTLSVSILADYTKIGIFKTFGFTSKQVRSVYVKLYGAICTIAIILGVLLSIFCSKLLLSIFGKSMGISSYSTLLIIPYMIITFVILTVVSYSVINKCARRAGKISAVQAIKFGGPPKTAEKNNRTQKNIYKMKSVTVIYALKQMFTNSSQIIFMGIASLVTVVVVVFSINVFTSIQNMGDDMSVWGMDTSDIRISLNDGYTDQTEIIDELLNDSRVSLHSKVLEYMPASIEATDDIASTLIVGNIYENSLDNLGLENIDGVNPEGGDEISLGINTAKKYGVKVGDKFSVVINGKKLELNVSGIYQTVSNTGNGYRMTAETYDRFGVEFDSNLYELILNDDVSKNDFISDYSNKYPDELNIEDSDSLVGGSISSVITNVGVGVFMMSVMFIVILMIIIANVITLYVHNERKNYGILKVCGMTSFQLRASLLEQMWIILLISIIVGIPVSIAGTPVMMNAIMSNMGMVHYPITTNFILTTISMIILFIVVSVVFWISSGSILKIKARELISE